MYSDAVLILPSKKSFKVISHSCRKAALYQKNLIFLQYYHSIIANFVTIL